MLAESLEELQNQHANAVAEIGHYPIGSAEWTACCEAAEKLNKTIKAEEERLFKEEVEAQRAEAEKTNASVHRKEDRHKQRMDFAKEAFKVGAQGVCLTGVALLVAKMERDPEAGISKGFGKVVDKVYRAFMG